MATSLHLTLALAVLTSAPVDDTRAQTASRCIAVMPATVTGVDGNAAEAGNAVRDLFISSLTGPSMQLVPLESRVRQLAIEEAKQKGCAYVVSASLSRKRGRGGSVLGSALGRAAGTAAWYVPGASTGAAVVRGLGAGAAEAVHHMATTTKAKDEMQLEWMLMPLGSSSTPSVKKDDKLKASSDGEDLLTPLVQRAAEAIVQAVLK